MKRGWIFILLGILALSLSSLSFPQEDIIGDLLEEEETESVEYSYGTVVTLDKNSNKITLNEYNWDSDTKVNVTYSVAPDVEVENITSWKEIPTGTEVDIAYVENKNGEKTIKYIRIYTKEEEKGL